MSSSTQQQSGELKTIREIAEEIGKPTYSLAYLIQTRGIREAKRVGIIRLYDAGGVRRIKEAAGVTT